MLTLRKEGLSYQAIADRLGIPYRRVYKALNRDQVRLWDKKSRQKSVAYATERTMRARRQRAHDCPVCGGRLSRPGAAPPCRACRKALYDEKLRDATRLWNDGVGSASIAAALEVSPAQVSSLIAEARRRGYGPVRRRRPRKESVIVEP